MTLPSRPLEWADRLARLYTPVVADVLDKLGFRNQCMDGRIRPLWPEAKVAGFALTVQTVPARETVPDHPYAGELAAVDSLRTGDVLVVSESGTSFWGELLSTSAQYRGCRGVVVVPLRAAEEALRLAEEKVSGENLVRKALAEGMTTTEAFAKFGIL